MYTDLVLDKPRRLRFDLPSLVALEAAMGDVPIVAIHTRIRQLSLTAICVATMVGLRHEDPSLTRDRTIEILGKYLTDGTGTLATITTALHEAIDQSGVFRDEEKKTVTPPS